jgi:hypothetical protein
LADSAVPVDKDAAVTLLNVRGNAEDGTGAEVTFEPVMNLDDLQRGLAALK